MAELPNIPTLQEFITYARQEGFARKDRYVVEFGVPQILTNAYGGETSNVAKSLSLLCEEATLPGKIINTRTLRINTLNELRAASTDYLGNSITFTFYVEREWSTRDIFSIWMSLITGNENRVDESQNPYFSNRAVAFYDDYISNIQITPLTPNSNTTRPDAPAYSIKLQEAWPISLHSQSLSYNNTDIQRINIEFAYKWWESIQVNTTLDNYTTDPKFTAKTQTPLNINLYNFPSALQDIYYGNVGAPLGLIRTIL